MKSEIRNQNDESNPKPERPNDYFFRASDFGLNSSFGFLVSGLVIHSQSTTNISTA
jgi:hypothetical protein